MRVFRSESELNHVQNKSQEMHFILRRFLKDALCDGEYLAKVDASQKNADRAYETIEDIIKTVVMVRKLHPYWD